MPKSKLLEIQEWVSTHVSHARLRHIQGVAQTAEKLAKQYGFSCEKARLAAWLHDSAKEISRSEMLFWVKKAKFHMDSVELNIPVLWHPHAGAGMALKKWGIRDKSVLDAIRCHTLGNPAMGPLAQLIFVADFIEPNRAFAGVAKARTIARSSLRDGILKKVSMTTHHLLENRKKVHPRLLETWNQFLPR